MAARYGIYIIRGKILGTTKQQRDSSPTRKLHSRHTAKPVRYAIGNRLVFPDEFFDPRDTRSQAGQRPLKFTPLIITINYPHGSALSCCVGFCYSRDPSTRPTAAICGARPFILPPGRVWLTHVPPGPDVLRTHHQPDGQGR